MKRDDLIRALRKHARKQGIPFDLDKGKGKGSHYTVYLGDKRTTLQSGEYEPFKLRRICEQLEVDPASL